MSDDEQLAAAAAAAATATHATYATPATLAAPRFETSQAGESVNGSQPAAWRQVAFCVLV